MGIETNCMPVRFFVPAFLLVMIFCRCSHQSKKELIEVKQLNYPSSSGIEYYNNHFYVIGDDATSLLILDSTLNRIDSVSLYNYQKRQIPKNIKEDLESIALSPSGKLWLIGSGSSPLRSKYWVLNLPAIEKETYSFLPLNESLKMQGIKDLNIEGSCFIPGYLLLANRGNNSYKHNHLIFITENTLNDSVAYNFKYSLIQNENNTTVFNGVSGLCYIKKEDLLICTISTEETNNSMDDGAIGKSYLWFINNISKKTTAKSIIPDRIIDLDSIDSRFKGNKIESVCVTDQADKTLKLVLVADNDNGNSSLFRLDIKNY
jgi:hypothetical protein